MTAMSPDRLADRIAAAFESLPPQLQAAARFALDHPEDVALLSMREQARRAGVPPVTMTRLARQLGFKDYQDFRDQHASLLRRTSPSPVGFSDRAGRLQQRQQQSGDAGLAAQIGWNVAEQIADCHDDEAIAGLIAAAKLIEKARRVHFLGARSCHAVAFHAHYIYSLFRDNGVLLDGAGDTGIDPLRHIGAEDVLLAVSVAPYATATIERVRYASARDTRIIAITDSRVSPLAKAAHECLLVPTETPSFFHAITPAFATAETLIALVAARAGETALFAIRNAEDQLNAFGTFWTASKSSRKRISS
ncbi:MurR/RpiR family transcriptional regulator [uncultured Ferrovibrio sp.]|jgi:DNA-binding MurR/RpiR family transcriptional regulator|uniref:MurR/RpiR family transcriptional regulator n=1 Tax=uncultured Ferrovibrio sp. TaxID=1576913 RepID=UPI002601C3F5|nr:MurR/RpiR family transcriptional regulator [uncultured Ferrovibrio sp.]